ncbi:MAG: hypothetical protein GOMPHAMPRED_005523 [Gomphillus americanus]|uniref:O-methyltransferase C-terminal domain-containing protein n=1 Tax=Gomphillus americanus TaxID=1940652 RepID=A0A8H3FYH1_9LECA|nr:MAG: hypothetical protein GOMPHAMPRED_005523 [Gomphillus americanus]
MPSIAELAASIFENTIKVNEYMTRNDIVIPSLDLGSPISWNIPLEATDILAARKAAIEATVELQTLLLGPREHFIQLTRFSSNIPIHAITRFNLANNVPINGEIAVKDLARQSKVDEQSLGRLLRYAINLKLFEYSKPGYICHSVMSRMLAENVDIHDYASASCNEMWPSSAHVVDALNKFPGSQEPNETGFNLANDTQLTLYQYVEQHPVRARQKLINKVGGSNGFVAIALAEAFSNLKCIVQDLPTVVKDMKAPANLSGRIEFLAHDFFEPQPVKNADVYFFRWILHNWPDKYAVRILQSLIPALKVGAKIIVYDEVLPPHGVLPEEMDLALAQLDINMMTLQNAKLRSAEEWKQLFEQADSRFKFGGITIPPGSALGFVEVEWMPTG